MPYQVMEHTYIHAVDSTMHEEIFHGSGALHDRLAAFGYRMTENPREKKELGAEKLRWCC